jgi:hypothetical protein
VTPEQLALTRAWTGPHDERYFAELRALEADAPHTGNGAEEPPLPESTTTSRHAAADRPVPADEMALEQCVATFRNWLHLPDPGALYVTLATAVANRAAGDPVWLLIVGPPGGGKTEIINSIAKQPDVHSAATLTEGALLSGVAKRDRAAGAKGGLLREIGDFGILLHKDFGSVLSMNRDTRAAVLAALREIYDGSWTRYVGTDGGRTLSWSGKVGMIAGCTPALDSHHAVIGSMGERFLLYRMPATEADTQARRALGHVGREKAMRAALSSAADAVLATAVARTPALTDEAMTERLVRIATLAVRCRSAVERDSYTREVTLIPEPEAPARLGLVLLRLLSGLFAIGVDEAEAWQLITKAALDSMPAIRRTVLENLMQRPMAVTTSEVAAAGHYPTVTARRALEDLAAHGVVERQAGGAGRPDLWQPAAWAKDRWPSVPDKSVTTYSEHGIGAEAAPLSLLLRTDDDLSEKVPPEDDYPASVWDAAP